MFLLCFPNIPSLFSVVYIGIVLLVIQVDQGHRGKKYAMIAKTTRFIENYSDRRDEWMSWKIYQLDQI